ncbi:phage holin family protein [Nonlabens marinus]|uniref:Putative membrane protein n=1 Tax=Nonlabens marinus S1-08 TaxID=1454201 RepID=W8VPG7_9FLAO|nr:phage holin family protein [Nonlabens marinus]BAO55039.1 putative membrane protein [Nonlabens marinus S1-08]
MKFLLNLLLTAILVILLSYLLPGVSTDGFLTAVWVALALSVLNFIVRPILVILTLPITVLTLGIFLLFINAFIIMMADWLVSGFEVENIWYALIFALLLAIARSILIKTTEDKGR